MSLKPLLPCALRGLVVVLALLCRAPLASAQGSAETDVAATKLRCAQAYEESQSSRQQGKLLAAREQALICAQARCPPVLSGECTGWLGELERALGSVVVELRSERGESITAASLRVDGEELASSLDGRALVLDPGTHRLELHLPDGRVLQRSVVLGEGRKGEYVRFQLPRAAAPVKAPSARAGAGRSPALRWSALAVTAAGAVGFGYFAWQGRADEARLSDSCAPRCSTASVASVERLYLAADFSLGIGVAALAAFSYLSLTRDQERRPLASFTIARHAASVSVAQSF